jgi:hypothetical protein
MKFMQTPGLCDEFPIAAPWARCRAIITRDWRDDNPSDPPIGRRHCQLQRLPALSRNPGNILVQPSFSGGCPGVRWAIFPVKQESAMPALTIRKVSLAAVVFGFAVAAHADDESMTTPHAQKVLRAMEHTSTWYHDDLFGEYAGFQRYARHQYAEALHFFELGAYYADKPSQFSIGLMHLNGEGVARDPVAAFAWFDLAAERGYLAFAVTRDRVRAMLTPEQLSQAIALRSTLSTRYADAVAKPRMAAELREGLTRMTGSRAGFDTGVKFLPLHAIDPAGSASLEDDAFTICANGFWAKDCWQPEAYFAMRDRQWNATVAVGPLEE